MESSLIQTSEPLAEMDSKEVRPEPPKKPFSKAFFLYSQDHSDRVKQENPDADTLRIVQILDKSWSSVDQQTKRAYEARLYQTQRQYEKDLEEYNKKYRQTHARKSNDLSEENMNEVEEEEYQKETFQRFAQEEARMKSNATPQMLLSGLFAKNEVTKINSNDARPKPPQKPCSSVFQLYSQDNSDRVRQENPDADTLQIVQILAKSWSNVDQQTKRAYESRLYQTQRQYEQDLEEYNKKSRQIYGSESRDMPEENMSGHQEEEYRKEEETHKRFIQEEVQMNSNVAPQKLFPGLFAKNEVTQIHSNDSRPKPPQKPCFSVFQLYKQDNSDQVRQENPNAKDVEIVQILAKNWSNVDEQTKGAYEARFYQAQRQYEKDLEEYNNKYREF